ncbi:MAG: AAA-like domain-containing protein [Anaerolineae bacterium]|nr:AAA-like domain-containing protein [Anaerolineae bacterium]
MFVTHGPVDPSSALFVGREAELARMAGWLANVTCVGSILGARQTGKTSLLLRLCHLLQERYAFTYVDLEAVQGANEEECFGYIADEILAQLGGVLGGAVRPLPTNSREFLAFLQQLSRNANAIRIGVILDEVGALERDVAIKLSHLIRAVFTSRLVRREYARYVFILAGATEMLKLATGRNSPLRNVTESVYLGDLSLAESEQMLRSGFSALGLEVPPLVGAQIYGWTGGHPYWTQLLAARVVDSGPAVAEGSVGALTEELLQVEERNLPHMLKALDSGGSNLWQAVARILEGAPVPFSRSDATAAELELIGVVRNESGVCTIRNNLYRETLQRRLGRQEDGSSDGRAWDTAPVTIHLAALRALITDAFTARDLWRFCHDRPLFRPVLSDVAENAGVGVMADALIQYCEIRLLLGVLLQEIEKLNPDQYERHRSRLDRGNGPSRI